MVNPLAFVLAALAVTALHTLSPDHWLPFVLVGKAQGWGRRSLASVVVKAGVGHVLVTSSMALLILIAGLELAHLAAGLEAYVAGPLLAATGLAYVIRYVHANAKRRAPGSGCHPVLPDRLARLSVVGAFTFSPCVGIFPVFAAASLFGPAVALPVLPVFASVTVGSMLFVTLAAYGGLRGLSFAKLERHERLFLGLVLLLLGFVVFAGG